MLHHCFDVKVTRIIVTIGKYDSTGVTLNITKFVTNCDWKTSWKETTMYAQLKREDNIKMYVRNKYVMSDIWII
jgi:hypothetical protein